MSGATQQQGVSAETLASISTPDRVESRLGTLEFADGAPSESTAQLLYDHLDFVHGVEAFINAFPGASLEAMHQGFLSIGVEDNSVLLFSELMDSASLFLTANCDTLYYKFLDPPPQITADGVVPSASDGARQLNSRITILYPYNGITPAMYMHLTGIGSQYLMTMRSGDGQFLDGARSYRLTLPPDIPQSRFWSVMLYDRQTRSMLQTDQTNRTSGASPAPPRPTGRLDRHLHRPTPPDGKTDNCQHACTVE